MKIVWTILIIFNIHSVFSSSSCKPSTQLPQPTSRIFTINIPSGLTDVLPTLFPPGSPPVQGFVQSDIYLKCVGPDCKMNITFLQEGGSYHNAFGYTTWNDVTGSAYTDVAHFKGIFPDSSEEDGGGCLSPGYSLSFGPFDNDTTVIFWLKPDGWDSSSYNPIGKDQDDIWWSRINPPSFVNDDGTTANPTRHFGWLNFQEYSTIVIGVEDLAGLGDEDFNDVMYTMALSSGWNTGSIQTYTPDGTIAQCTIFDPYKNLNQLTTYNCTAFTVMDDTVSGERLCKSYFRLPDGWSVSPLDNYYSGALSIQTQLGYWQTDCAIGQTSGSVTSGYYQDSNGYLVPCNPSSPVGIIYDTDGAPCYYAQCNARVVIRKDAFDPTCNSAQTSQYCVPSASSVTTNPLATPSNTLFVTLVPGQTLPYSFLIPIKNQIQIFVLIDPFNCGSRSSTNDQLIPLVNTLQYLIPSTGYYTTGVSWGYTGSTSTTDALTLVLPFTYSSSALDNGNYIQYYPGSKNPSNILSTLTQVLNNPDIGWANFDSSGISQRVIYVLTKSKPDTSSSVVNTLKTAMVNSELAVVFCTTSTYKKNYKNLISKNDLPRAAVATITWPSQNTDTYGSIYSQAQSWQSAAITQARAILSEISIVQESDTIGIVNTLPPVSLVDLPTDNDITVQSYTTNAITFTLPNGIPGSKSANRLPGKAIFRVIGSSYDIPVNIYWNEPPTLWSDPITTPCYENLNCTVKLVDSVNSALDPNKNLIDIEFINITNAQGDNAVSNFSSILTYGGTGPIVSVPLPQSSPYTRYPNLGLVLVPKLYVYGVYTLKYQLFDGCLASSVGTAVINIQYINQAPQCSNIALTVEETFSSSFSFTSVVNDVDNSFSQLNIIWTTTTDSYGFIRIQTGSVNPNTPISANSAGWSYVAQHQGTAVYQYKVSDGQLLSTTCSLTVTINPKDIPPVISASPTTIITSPNTNGTISINISDPVLGNITNFYIQAISIDTSVIDLMRPTFTYDPRPYTYFTTIETSSYFLCQFSLKGNDVAGKISFPFVWHPNKFHPSTTTHQVKIWAVDEKSQQSNIISLTFKVPSNVPPKWLGTTVSTSYSESSGPHVIPVVGTDSIYQNDLLKLTITALPTRGTIVDKNGKPISVGSVLVFPDQSSHSSGENSTYPITYTSTPYQNGPDSFSGYFTDPEKAQSLLGTISITLTPVNNPPSTDDVSVSLLSSNSTTIDFDATDIDLSDNPSTGEILTFKLVSVSSLVGNITRTCDGEIGVDGQTTNSTCGFSYIYHSPPFSINETFTFEVIDKGGQTSGIHTAYIHVIQVIPPNVPPTVTNKSFSGTEDEELFFSLDSAFNDTDGLNSLVKVFLKSLPSNGQLLDANRASALINSLLSRDVNGTVAMSFVPSSNWFGQTSFTFFTKDSNGASSLEGTITLKIVSVNDPPTISISPSSVQVDRNSTATIEFTVSDFDSDSVTLSIFNNNLQLSLSDVSVGGVIVTSTTSITSTIETGLVNLFGPPPGFVTNIPLTWTPYWNVSDDTTVFVIAEAKDSDGGVSTNQVRGDLSVNPNNIPTIVSVANYSNVVVDEDAWSELLFSLIGTDIDVYHRNILQVYLSSLQQDLEVTDDSLYVIQSSDLPYQLLPSVPQGPNTYANLLIHNKKDWNGVFTFSFYVQDVNTPIPGVSSVQEVQFTVNPINDPPVTSNVSLTVPEGLCIVVCPPGVQWAPDATPSVVLTASDIDSSVFYLEFPSIDLSYGLLGYNGPDVILNHLDQVETEDSFPNSQLWRFWYQPTSLKHSDNCQGTEGNYHDCDPYVIIPFNVVDDQNATSNTGYLFIYVTPVDDPPVALTSTATIAEDTTLTFSFDPYVYDFDNSNDELDVYVDTIDFNTQGKFYDSLGTYLSPDSPTSIKLVNKTIVFVPDQYTYSNPSYTPLGTLNYYVQDPDGKRSSNVVFTVFVTPVPHPFNYFGNLNQTILEDSFTSIYVGRRTIDWTNIDQGDAIVNITTISSVGSWKVCKGPSCSPLNASVLPFTVDPLSNIQFVPLPNDNGMDYANFTFTLQLADSYNTEVITRTYIINVLPVNDPPVLVPLWPLDTGLSCDEDTYLKFAFTATDIDSPLNSLRAQIIDGLDSDLSAKLYLCSQDVPDSDCKDGDYVNNLDIQSYTEPAHWNFSYIPATNANGGSRLSFIVVDDLLAPSNPATAKITVYPINDPPYFVASIEEVNTEASSQSDIDSRPYSFLFTVISDIDFVNDWMQIYINASLGHFTIDGNVTLPCTIDDASHSFYCHAELKDLKQYLKFVLFNADWTDPHISNGNVTLHRNVTIFLDDIGNIDKRGSIARLNYTETYDVKKVFYPVADSLIGNKVTSNNTVSIAMGVGIGVAILIAAIIALAMRKNKKNVDQYLAEFLSNTSTAGDNVSPLYTPATKSYQSALYNQKNIVS